MNYRLLFIPSIRKDSVLKFFLINKTFFAHYIIPNNSKINYNVTAIFMEKTLKKEKGMRIMCHIHYTTYIQRIHTIYNITYIPDLNEPSKKILDFKHSTLC